MFSPLCLKQNIKFQTFLLNFEDFFVNLLGFNISYVNSPYWPYSLNLVICRKSAEALGICIT